MRPTPKLLTFAALLAMSADAETILTVRVYDYTRQSDNTILKAELLVRQLFLKIGVETEWVHCPTEGGEADRFAGCRKPGLESDVILHVIPQSMESRSLSGDAFGYALQPSGGQPANHAYVFFHRVEQAARKSQRTARTISHSALLAHVVAHEIGHLILGPNSHSGRGVMRARWRQEDLQEMEIGQLVFSAEQAKSVRSRIEGRVTGGGK